MAWGEKRGGRASGEYGLFDKAGFGLSAAMGIAAATIIDLTQSDDASALYVFNKWVGGLTETLGLGGLPLYAIVLILMGIGAASVFYLQPVTLRGAFAQGFGVLAAIMTLAPSDLGTPLPGMNDGMPLPSFSDEGALPPPAEGFGDDEVAPDDIVFRPALAPVLATPLAMAAGTTAVAQQGYNVRIRVVFPEGLSTDVATMVRRGTLRGRLVNKANNTSYNLFRNTGAGLNFRGNTLYIATTLPGSGGSANLRARIEADGYDINDSSFTVRQGDNPTWTITMEPSGTPLFLQRLRRSPL